MGKRSHEAHWQKSHRDRTHISEVSVEHFDISVNDLQRHEFVVIRADSTDEEERCISTIDDLCIFIEHEFCMSHRGWVGMRTFVLEKVAHSRPPSENELRDIFHNLGLCLGRKCCKPLG